MERFFKITFLVVFLVSFSACSNAGSRSNLASAQNDAVSGGPYYGAPQYHGRSSDFYMSNEYQNLFSY